MTACNSDISCQCSLDNQVKEGKGTKPIWLAPQLGVSLRAGHWAN